MNPWRRDGKPRKGLGRISRSLALIFSKNLGNHRINQALSITVESYFFLRQFLLLCLVHIFDNLAAYVKFGTCIITFENSSDHFGKIPVFTKTVRIVPGDQRLTQSDNDARWSHLVVTASMIASDTV